MIRKRLPERRDGITTRVLYAGADFARDFVVSCNRDEAGAVKEVFCWPVKSGAGIEALIADFCIAVSIALQHGVPVAELSASMGELSPEGAEDGKRYPPASPAGAILRAAAELEEAFGKGGNHE